MQFIIVSGVVVDEGTSFLNINAITSDRDTSISTRIAAMNVTNERHCLSTHSLRTHHLYNHHYNVQAKRKQIFGNAQVRTTF